MKSIKKPLSLLLSLIMIFSVFTIIPVASASAESVQVFARKWVKADPVTGDYFSFTDLYSNFIICRGNPSFDETNFNVDDTTNVYNRTGDISLGNYNEIRLNSWNDGSGYLNYYTSTNNPAVGDGKIYLSTNGDNINFNIDDVTWYAYTWETFNAESVDAVSPTYDENAQYPYQHGTMAHYVSGDRKFVAIDGATDNHQNIRQVKAEELVVPYFVFSYYNNNSDSEWGVSGYNSSDTVVVIPDKIPDNYPDESLRGKDVEYLHFTAFGSNELEDTSNKNITKVVMGDTMKHLGWHAFRYCTSLKEVEIGTGLRRLDAYVFYDCPALEKFTCTKVDDDITVVSRCFNSDVTFYGYHDGSFRYAVSEDKWSLGAKPYIGLDDHIYSAHFNWNGYECPTMTVTCTECDLSVDVDASVSSVDTIPVTAFSDGLRTYTATAVYDNHTYTDTKTETVSAFGVKYLDENGNEQTARNVTPITADTTSLASGWYAVDGSVTVNGDIDITGSAKIILTDGCDLTVAGELGKLSAQNNYPIFFYRQSGENEGKLTAASITASNINLVGGEITSNIFVRAYGNLSVRGGKLNVPALTTKNAVDCDGNITITGGYLDITGATCLMTLNGTVTITGGNTRLSGFGAGIYAKDVVFTGGVLNAAASDVDHDGKGIKSSNPVQISWTDAAHDSFFSSGFDHNVILKKSFKDQNGTIYMPRTYDTDALASMELTPAFPHEHTLTFVPAAAPDCVNEGNIECWHCPTCDLYFADQEGYKQIPRDTAVIPADGHDFDHTAAVAPTYDSAADTFIAGNIEYWHCSVCGKYFSDANGNTEIAQADTAVQFFDFEKLDNGTARIVKYNSHDADVIIPDTMPESLATDDLPVGTVISQVGAYSFMQNTYIKNVTMGDNIDTIDYQAFQYCSNLETVTVGSGLNNLRYQSFRDCPNLKSFTCTSRNTFTYNENLGEPFGASLQAVAYVYHGSSLMIKLSLKTIGIDRHSEPAWTWANDYSSATASFNCSKSKCKYHNDGVAAEVTSEITTLPTPDTDGVRTYTAVVVIDGETYLDTRTEVIPKVDYFPKHNLTLSGDIGVNFYVKADSADVDAGKAKVTFDWNDKTESVTLGGTPVTVDGMQLYKATAYVSAAEMNDDITATLYIDNVETAVHHYSVRDYCDVILSDDYKQSYSNDRFEYDELATLVKTMLNYGAMAQKQFSHNIDNLANHDVNYPLNDLETGEIDALGSTLPKSTDFDASLAPYGVKYYGCSMLLRSKTTLRFYFLKTGNGEYSADNFKINGETVEVKTYQDSPKYVYIEITDIASPDLADAYNITVGNVSIGSVSPLNYVKDVLMDDSASEGLYNVITALYRYYEAAHELFN